MNFLRIVFFSLFVAGSCKTNAQISGQVIDNAKNAIPFCSVLLTKVSDTSLITVSATDQSGNFQLEIKDTGYVRIIVAYIGYKKFYSQPISITKQINIYNAGTIILESDAQMLNGVQIVAEKPFVEYKIDRTVFNIENSVISSGTDGLGVLKKLPGVSVGDNDAIKVGGKPGVLIMIDGKTSFLSTEDLSNYLRSLNASQIEKIEVITNPSAKYDASGNAIINIVLKKDNHINLKRCLN